MRVAAILAALVCVAAARTVQFGHFQDEAFDVPLVSLVCAVDTSEQAEFLVRALAYANQQSYANLELVVVDSNSVNRQDMIPPSELNWVTYVHAKAANAEGGSPSAAASLHTQYAAAVQAARGSVLMLWDVRDIHASTRVEAQVTPILQQKAGARRGRLRFGAQPATVLFISPAFRAIPVWTAVYHACCTRLYDCACGLR